MHASFRSLLAKKFFRIAAITVQTSHVIRTTTLYLHNILVVKKLSLSLLSVGADHNVTKVNVMTGDLQFQHFERNHSRDRNLENTHHEKSTAPCSQTVYKLKQILWYTCTYNNYCNHFSAYMLSMHVHVYCTCEGYRTLTPPSNTSIAAGRLGDGSKANRRG